MNESNYKLNADGTAALDVPKGNKIKAVRATPEERNHGRRGSLKHGMGTFESSNGVHPV